jgi:uncharacterized protein (TIGR02996 family)
MRDESALLGALAAGDDTARLAYADLLEERADPRAAWVLDPEIWRWMAPDAHDPVPGLIAALHDRDWARQGNVRIALSRIGAVAVPALLEVLERGEANAADPAAQALSMMPCEALEPVLPQLFKLAAEEHDDVRRPAITALQGAGAAAVPALDSLIRALDLDPDKDHALARSAAVVLRNIGPPAIDAVPDLLVLACESSNEAEEALAAIGPAAVPIILREIRYGLDYDHNTLNAVGALKRMGVEIVPLLREAIATGDEWVRAFASLALAEHDPAAALPGLITGLEVTAGDRARQRDHSFAVALRDLGPLAAPAAETMRRLLPTLSGRAREVVAEVLAKLGQAETTTADLLHQLGDSDPRRRADALAALYHLKELPEQVVASVFPLLGDEPRVCWEVRNILDWVANGPQRHLVWPTLLPLVGHPHEVIARWACALVGKWAGEADAQDALRAALRDVRPAVRAAAADQLGGPGIADLTCEFVRLSGDSDPAVRAAAVRRLGDTGPMSPVVGQAIRAALADGDAEVRARAALAAGIRGPVEVGPVADLVRLAWQDADSAVRSSAVDQLTSCNLPPAEVVSLLRFCLTQNSDEGVRGAAAYAIGEVARQPAGTEAAVAALPDLLALLGQDNADPVVLALHRFGPAAVPGLIAALRDGNDRAQKKACEVLAGLGSDAAAAVEALLATLDSANRPLRDFAAWALAAIGSIGTPAIPTLRRLLWADTDCQVAAAITALVRVGATACFPALAGMVRDSTSSLAATALWGACRLGEPALVVLLLKEAMESPVETVRAVASVERSRLEGGPPPTISDLIGACGVMGLRDHLIEQLIQRSADPDGALAVTGIVGQSGQDLPWFGMEVLAQIGSHHPEVVVRALSDAPPGHTSHDRHVTLWGLGEFGVGSRVAFTAILGQMRICNHDPHTRAVGVWALRRLLSAASEDAP